LASLSGHVCSLFFWSKFGHGSFFHVLLGELE